MEHIVQFAIGIDDRSITERVEANAEKIIIKNLQQQVANKLFRSYYYNSDVDIERDPLSDFSKNLILEFLNENKEIIIQKTAKELSDRLMRSKAGKAIFEDVKEKGDWIC